MSVVIQDVINDIQSAIATNNAGLDLVPNNPPENFGSFPACVAYLDTFAADVQVPGVTLLEYTIVVEVHIGSTQLYLDVEQIIDYVEDIALTLYTTLSARSRSNIKMLGSMSYEFGDLQWRNQETRGFIFRIENVRGQYYTSEAAPTAPSNLVASAVGISQIDLTWTDNSDNELAFIVQRSLTSGSGFVTVAILAAGSTSYSDTGLDAGTTYYYQVVANGSGGTSTSNEANATTGAQIIYDTFTDVLGTALTAHAPDIDTPGKGWQFISGSVEVRLDKAQKVAANASMYLIDTDVTDMTVSAVCRTSESLTRFIGIVGRSNATGSSRFSMLISIGTNSMRIDEDGTIVRAVQSVTLSQDTDYTLSAAMSGSNITFTINGGNSLSYGSAAATNDYAGIEYQGAGGANAYTWDNFEVIPS